MNTEIMFFCSSSEPFTVDLDSYGKDELYFGKEREYEGRHNDIVFPSKVVSRTHGRFVRKEGCWYIEDKACYESTGSTNGLSCNDVEITRKKLFNGDIIRIDSIDQRLDMGVMMMVTSSGEGMGWQCFVLDDKKQCTIGRGNNCDLVLSHISVSRQHAVIIKSRDSYVIKDLDSTNGVTVNNQLLTGIRRLQEKDIIVITNTKLVFTCGKLWYYIYNDGISVDALGITITSSEKGKIKTRSDDVTLNVSPGELVAIIGCSGAGKSTILKCMCGSLRPATGQVLINGVDLYANFDAVKKQIGYVPQSDIVYDDLSVKDMLTFTAKLRLPKGTGKAELEKAVSRALDIVDMNTKTNSRISELSGGQRKRVSIAAELVSDPPLMFLDEPASGLDPNTERHLMQSLRSMADSGKTVILVTHSTLQLRMCDKIAFMGVGGNLCFYGTYEEAMSFFATQDIVDAYDSLSGNAQSCRKRYDHIRPLQSSVSKPLNMVSGLFLRGSTQFPPLLARYLKRLINSFLGTAALTVIMPLVIIGIFFPLIVHEGNQYHQYEITKNLFYALSCSSCFFGLFTSMKSVSEEESILRREYKTGLSVLSYTLSKHAALIVLSVVQGTVISLTFTVAAGLPDKGIRWAPFAEIWITTVLLVYAASSMGLFASATGVAVRSFLKGLDVNDIIYCIVVVILLLQILASGIIFKFSDGVRFITAAVLCRWGMEAYGSIANLNSLEYRLAQEGYPIVHEAEDMFTASTLHLTKVWGVMAVFSVTFAVLTMFTLRISLNRNNE